MAEVEQKGGMIKGKSHDDGGEHFIVPETGQHIEAEGGEPLIPEEAMRSKSKRTYTGTNKQVLDKISKAVGGKGMNQKAEQIHAGDAIVCVKSADDKEVRTWHGTPKQVVSGINESNGCKQIEEGAVATAKDGTKTRYEYGGLTKSESFENWFGSSHVIDEHGRPMVVFHGTTHDWNIYNTDKGNPENDMGMGFYATSDYEDANRNYLAEGQDITQRIDLRAERIMSEAEWQDKEIDEDEARRIAEEEIRGKAESVMPVYLSLKNPLHLSEDRSKVTWLDFTPEYDEEGEFVDESETLTQLHDAVLKTGSEYGIDGQQVFNNMAENAGEIYGEVSANDLVKAFKQDYSLLDDTSDDKGNTHQNEFIRRVFEKMGFDGVVYHEPQIKFPNMGIVEGTKHYIAFEPTQIKSATGNIGTFDPDNPDINMETGGLIVYCGECYDYALDFAKKELEWEQQRKKKSKAKIIYATLKDKWSGEQFLHAFVEKNGQIYDWQNVIYLRRENGVPAKQFYGVYEVIDPKIHTPESAVQAAEQHGHSAGTIWHYPKMAQRLIELQMKQGVPSVEAVQAAEELIMESGGVTRSHPASQSWIQDDVIEKQNDNSELEEGIDIESEHRDVYLKLKEAVEEQGITFPISEREFYRDIAQAHIEENPHYYTLLRDYVENYDKGGAVAPIPLELLPISTMMNRHENPKEFAKEYTRYPDAGRLNALLYRELPANGNGSFTQLWFLTKNEHPSTDIEQALLEKSMKYVDTFNNFVEKYQDLGQIVEKVKLSEAVILDSDGNEVEVEAIVFNGKNIGFLYEIEGGKYAFINKPEQLGKTVKAFDSKQDAKEWIAEMYAGYVGII